ncbi:MAG: ABC transporter permease [Methanoregulaceae archaeon]|nr:MAG: ABC transporter permease [Methanoregulaceae archaeon]
MTYLIFVAMFGTAATLFLWLRDARIFFRTALPGYRKAAYHGVLFGALASLGYLVTLTMESFELLGLGLILAALYLQGKIEREKVWKDEGTLERFFGSVPVHRANKK